MITKQHIRDWWGEPGCHHDSYAAHCMGTAIHRIFTGRLGDPRYAVNTGGGCMVFVWELPDGTVLTVNEEVAVHHRSMSEFWMDGGDYAEISSVSFWDAMPLGADMDAEPSPADMAKITAWLDALPI